MSINGVIYTGIYLSITTLRMVEVKKKMSMLRNQRVIVFIVIRSCKFNEWCAGLLPQAVGAQALEHIVDAVNLEITG